jgi:predicted DNA-binding protein (UPF0251 family)
MNRAPETVADLSSLTRVQVQTLKMHLAVGKHEINMQQALKSRKISGISRGTHYRILAQAKKKVKRSLFTVAAAAQLGLVKGEDVQKLISSVCLIPADANPEKMPEILALVNAVADRIVML